MRANSIYYRDDAEKVTGKGENGKMYLSIIERAEDTKPGRPAWHCQCECGNITTVTSTALLKTGGEKPGVRIWSSMQIMPIELSAARDMYVQERL